MVPLSRRSVVALAGGTALGALPGVQRRRAFAVGPTESDWQALLASIDGELFRPGGADFDDVRLLHNTRFDDVVPAAVLRARSSGDVAEAIRFARRFGLPLRPRAGGHSYVGDSTVAGGLVIDVRTLDAIRYEPATRQVRVGAGARTDMVILKLGQRGRAIPTGTCPTVGLVGLALGGGLGTASTRHGLTCDALTELTLVTADGRLRRVRPGHPLFWAACGGGGGTFGVVTAMRFRTHAARPMGIFSLGFRWEDAAQVLAGWGHHVQEMPRSVWCNVTLRSQASESSVVQVTGRCRAGQSEQQAEAFVRAIGRDATHVWHNEASFMGGTQLLAGDPHPQPIPWVAGSDVVPAVTPALSQALPAAVDAWRGSSPAMVILDPLTGAVQDVAPRASAFPWRRHVAELQWFVRLPPDPTGPEVREAQSWVSAGHEAIAAESVGAYVNRVEPGRRPRDYYAGNVRRLRRLKGRVDPDNVFTSPYTLRAPRVRFDET